MKVTYIYNSGCAIEFNDFSLIIDYYKDTVDEEVEMGWVNNYLLKKDKPLYVLCTHSHGDHFNEEVLSWNRDKENITYIFSKEIADNLQGTFSLKDEEIVFLEKFEEFNDGNLRVVAFGSTDVGGSFYIEHDGYKMFHAGDLNNWHWNEEATREESYVYENHFICELELLYEQVKEVDIAMFPLDPRLGQDFMRGGKQFVEKIKTRHFMPLHFGEHYELLKQFEPIASAANCHLLELEERGQSFNL